MRVWLWKIIAVCSLVASVAFSVPFTFTYSGRLLDSTTGQPISGTRSIKITFWTAQTGGSQLAANSQTGVTNDTYSVTLASGVFSQTINLSAANFHTVFPDSTTGTWVQVQDMTAGVTYPRQQFTTVPYALKVPVDGTTITYNSSGSLQVNALSSSNLPATINSTNVTASGYMGVGTTNPGSFGNNAKFAVSNGVSYFYAADDLYGSAMFGPRKANDGYSTVMYSWGANGSGNHWQQDASSGALQWQRNAAGVSSGPMMTLTSSGNLGIGTTAPQERLRVIDDSANYTASMAIKYPPSNASTSLNYVGQWSETNTINSTGQLNALYGSVNRVIVNTAGSAVAGINGSTSDVYVTANRPITNALGLNSAVNHDSTGTITNAYSLVGSVNRTSTGAITNGYGLYINQVQATNKFGVYSADSTAANVLMGNTGIGTNSPAAKLDVAGEIKLGNTSASCSASTVGSLRYNTTLNQMEFCDGASWAAVVQEAVDPAVSGGRLTVVTGTVSVPNTTGATTLYYTPAVSNKIALYNGTNWRVYTFSEFSLALSGLTSGKNYDVFVYLNNGSPALELGSAWTNDTTRASNLAFNIVYTKSGDATRKYVGTIRASGTTTTEDSDSKRFVWNFYNQRPSNFTKHTTKSDSNSAVWGYSTQAWRAFNNDTTGRVEYVTGTTQSVFFSFSAILQISYAGICFDCTNNASVTVHNGGSTGYILAGSRLEELPGIGYHFVQATEHGWNSTSGIGYIDVSGMIQN